MAKTRRKLQVFLSHSSRDDWIARHLAVAVEARGATTFLDHSAIEAGDDFDAKILKAAAASQELLILLTPWSLQRPYLWMELGLFWKTPKRIVCIYHGFTAQEIAAHDGIPVLLKRGHLLSLNESDQYLKELADRVRSWSAGNG